MYCKNCGKEIANDSKFCMYCGCQLLVNQDDIEDWQWEIEAIEEQNIEKIDDFNESNSRLEKKENSFWNLSRIAAIVILFGVMASVIVGALSMKNRSDSKLVNNSITSLESDEYDFQQNYDYVGEYNEDGIAVASLNGYYGFIDNTGHELTEFIYEMAENFVDGLALVKKDGYYGYIDVNGNTIIGFMYDAATSFDAEYGLAIVTTGNGKGVIDETGVVIVDTQYPYIYFDSGFIITGNSENYWDGGYNDCGVFTVDGVQIVENKYRNFYFINDKIYAIGSEALGDLYDFNGNNLLYSESLLGALAITPPINGVSIAEYEGEFFYSWNGSKEYHYYMYYDTDLNLISDMKLSWTTKFNKLGYAIACYSLINNPDSLNEDEVRHNGMNGHDYAIIRNDGTEVSRLPEPDYLESYVDVNDYFVIIHDGHGQGSDMLLDRVSMNKISCDSPEMVDETNCIIVKNEASGLYGLYDGADMVKEYLYNEISYNTYDNLFTLTRGAETEEYTPVNDASSEKDFESNENNVYIVVTAVRAVVRTTPGGEDVIMVAQMGDRFILTDKVQDVNGKVWYQILIGEDTGYIRSDIAEIETQ